MEAQVRTRQLELFIRVCELGSISRAAEQLNIAQPALGMQIRNLEHEFGAELITRHSRGVQLTPAGTVVLEAARDILRRLQEARAAVKAGPQSMLRTVTVGLSPSMASMLASQVITEAAIGIRGVVVKLVEELSHVLTEWAQADRLDLALAYSVTGPRLRLTPLLREQLFVVTAAESRKAAGTDAPLDLAEALSGPLALPGENDSVRATVEAAAAATGQRLSVRYEIQSITAIKQLVAGGLATSILPWGSVRREVEAGELTALPIGGPGLFRTLFLVQVPGRDEPEMARLLVRLAHGLAHAGDGPGRFSVIEGAVSGMGGAAIDRQRLPGDEARAG